MQTDLFQGIDAQEAYVVGHKKALDIAREAGRQSTPGAKDAKLKEAYCYDAFACHFLTDLFSSGHLRVDRRGLHTSGLGGAVTQGYSAYKEKPAWDLQAQIMHDDDSATGLMVSNRDGDCWIAYGDKQLMEGHSTVNRWRW